MNQTEEQNNRIPSIEQVTQQLERMLSNPLFSKASKLSNFLKYVAVETLEGRAGRIKGYTIASEVFGRSDPDKEDTSTIVRVEAGRLRRNLQDYYQSDGRQDPVHIEIPKVDCHAKRCV